LNLKKIPYF